MNSLQSYRQRYTYLEVGFSIVAELYITGAKTIFFFNFSEVELTKSARFLYGLSSITKLISLT